MSIEDRAYCHLGTKDGEEVFIRLHKKYNSDNEFEFQVLSCVYKSDDDIRYYIEDIDWKERWKEDVRSGYTEDSYEDYRDYQLDHWYDFAGDVVDNPEDQDILYWFQNNYFSSCEDMNIDCIDRFIFSIQEIEDYTERVVNYLPYKDIDKWEKLDDNTINSLLVYLGLSGYDYIKI